MAVSPPGVRSTTGFKVNHPPSGFSTEHDLAPGFTKFLAPLHERLAPWQQTLIAERRRVLEQAHAGHQPSHLSPSSEGQTGWRIELPQWCQDQRNQMTGPADDAELVVKMLNSGAPGVMLDLEDSTVNEWDHQLLGAENILHALSGKLTYDDKKRNTQVGIRASNTVIWIRPRGLHLNQGGLFDGELCSASL